MGSVILVIHLFLALAIIGLVLLQRSEGGGLGMGGGGMGGLASPRGAANLLTRATGICAALFFCTSLILGIMAGAQGSRNTSILDELDQPGPAAVEAPVQQEQAPATSQKESGGATEAPSVPIAE
jgi:preprotein translocase subunit SecG